MAARKPRAKPPEPTTKEVHIHVGAPGAAPSDEPEDVERDDDDGDDDGLAAVDQMAAEVASNTVVKLYRSHPSLGGREAFLTEMSPDSFSPEAVKNTYGGGRYRAQWFGPTRGKAGKPGRGPLRQVAFDVDLSLPPKSPVTGPISNPGDMPNDPVGRGGSRLDAVMESGVISLFQSMQNANATQMAMMQKLLDSSNSRGPDMASILTAAAPIVAALIQSFGNRPDPMQAAREIAELATSKTNAASDLKAMLEAVKELRTLTGDAPPADDDTPPWMKLLERTAGPLLAAAMQRDRQAVAEPNPSAVPYPGHSRAAHEVAAPNLQSPPVIAPATPNESVPSDLIFVQPFVSSLVQWASQGRSAEWAAETILYEVPQGLLSTVAARLQADDIVTRMTAAFPALAPFDVWLGEFRGAVLAQIAGDDTTGG